MAQFKQNSNNQYNHDDEYKHVFPSKPKSKFSRRPPHVPPKSGSSSSGGKTKK